MNSAHGDCGRRIVAIRRRGMRAGTVVGWKAICTGVCMGVRGVSRGRNAQV